jgi:hypothetical protein
MPVTDRLVTMQGLLAQFPALSERTLRYWMQTDPDDFRKRCMLVVGRKSFFDLPGVEVWLLDHRGARGK